MTPQLQIRLREAAATAGTAEEGSDGDGGETVEETAAAPPTQEDRFVRKINFDSHVRQVKTETLYCFPNSNLTYLFPQVQMEGDSLFLLHWDGRISLFSVEELLSARRANDELMTRLFDFCHT